MFVDPLTDDDLYWIGYIRADGCLFHPRTPGQSGRLVFNQKYIEPVAALRAYVKEEKGKISENVHKDGYGKGNKFYVFSSRNGYKELLALGTKTTLREDIYKSRHFWRGLMDGDGCICLTKTNRGKNDSITITLCGSKIDMERYLDFAESIGNVRTKLFCYYTSWKVAFGGIQAYRIIHHLYKDSYSILPYKKDRAERALLWKPTRKTTLAHIASLANSKV